MICALQNKIFHNQYVTWPRDEHCVALVLTLSMAASSKPDLKLADLCSSKRGNEKYTRCIAVLVCISLKKSVKLMLVWILLHGTLIAPPWTWGIQNTIFQKKQSWVKQLSLIKLYPYSRIHTIDFQVLIVRSVFLLRDRFLELSHPASSCGKRGWILGIPYNK